MSSGTIKFWKHVAVSIGLPEKDDGDRDGLQSIFTHLLASAPTNTPFQLHDVRSCRSVCGDDLKPDFVMSLRHKPMVPMTTGFVLDLKRQYSQCDSSKNIGKAITYGRMCLQQQPRTLRSTVLVGLTYLHTITLIRVTLPMQPDQEGSMSIQVSEAWPGVRDTLLQLLSSHPSDLQVNMPDLGPSFEAIDFLGHGATSNVYKHEHKPRLAARSHHNLFLICLLSSVVAKCGIKPLDSEFLVLSELQGVAGVPSLAYSSCLNNSIITATVLELLAWSTISMQHLHHTYPALAHTLQVGHNAHCS